MIDGPHYIVGLITVFKQYHPIHYKKYLLYLCHYAKNAIHLTAAEQMQYKKLSPEAWMVLAYLEEVIKFDQTSREIIG